MSQKLRSKNIGRLKRTATSGSSEGSSSVQTKGEGWGSAFGDSESNRDESELMHSGVGTRSVTNYSDYSDPGYPASRNPFNHERFKGKVENLLQYAHTNVSELPAETADDLNEITALTRVSTGTVDHERIRRITLSVFGAVDPSKIEANTVASKILGCQISRCPAVPMGCGPLCAGSISGDDQPGCSNAVFLYENNTFILLTHGAYNGRRNAYVYVPDTFDGFEKSDLDQLIQHKVNRIKLVHLDENSECVQMSEGFEPPSNFLKKASERNSRNHHHDDEPPSSWWWVLIIVLVLFLIIGVMAFVFMRARPPVSANDKYMQGQGYIREGLGQSIRDFVANLTPMSSPERAY